MQLLLIHRPWFFVIVIIWSNEVVMHWAIGLRALSISCFIFSSFGSKRVVAALTILKFTIFCLCAFLLWFRALVAFVPRFEAAAAIMELLMDIS